MCGIFGIFGHPEAANLTYLGLHALQHRGQESAGIVSLDDGDRSTRTGRWAWSPTSSPRDVLERLPGDAAIGHVRYSTAGGSRAQERAAARRSSTPRGPLAVAHNGNLVNAQALRERAGGATARSSSPPPTPR